MYVTVYTEPYVKEAFVSTIFGSKNHKFIPLKKSKLFLRKKETILEYFKGIDFRSLFYLFAFLQSTLAGHKMKSLGRSSRVRYHRGLSG